MLPFEARQPLKKPLVTTLTEKYAFTSRNYEVKKGINVPKSSKSTN